MKQLVPSGNCLSCQGCCRFSSCQSAWVTKLLPAEQSALKVKSSSVPLIQAGEAGPWFCAYLDRTSNACTVYAGRPLECRLYPFLLNRRQDGQVFLASDPNCPFVQEHRGSRAFRDYARELAAYLCSPQLRTQLENADHMLTSYEGAIDCEYLFSIPPRP